MEEIKTGPGRPRKHADAAARQKAYRARQKAAGLREIKTMVLDVRDTTKPLKSELIDLSKARGR